MAVLLSIFGETVLAAISFDDNSFLKAGRIDNVSPDRSLAAKVKAELFKRAEFAPQFNFLRG